MSFNYFQNNPNYKQIFLVRDYDKCESAETVELYQHILDKYYVLYRYTHIDGTYPIRVVNKFTSILSYEVVENGGRIVLMLTTIFGNNYVASQRFAACCGSKIHVLKVENELTKSLF